MKNEKCVKDEPHSDFTKEEQQEFLKLLNRITPEQREALKEVLYSGRNARIKSKIAVLCEGESLSQMVKRDFCSSVKW